jgi:two-component system cell cycle response regulator CtrA
MRCKEVFNFIVTVWGRGYVLREPHEEEVGIPA